MKAAWRCDLFGMNSSKKEVAAVGPPPWKTSPYVSKKIHHLTTIHGSSPFSSQKRWCNQFVAVFFSHVNIFPNQPPSPPPKKISETGGTNSWVGRTARSPVPPWDDKTPRFRWSSAPSPGKKHGEIGTWRMMGLPSAKRLHSHGKIQHF